jgi:Protein of unknown function (DUF2934)
MQAPRTLTAVPTANQQTKPTGELQEKIRRRAYELYDQHGRNNGHDLDDWLQAESEVTRQKPSAIAA